MSLYSLLAFTGTMILMILFNCFFNRTITHSVTVLHWNILDHLIIMQTEQSCAHCCTLLHLPPTSIYVGFRTFCYCCHCCWEFVKWSAALSADDNYNTMIVSCDCNLLNIYACCTWSYSFIHCWWHVQKPSVWTCIIFILCLLLLIAIRCRNFSSDVRWQ